MKILLVEDDDAIAMGLKYSLEKEEYEVVHVKTVAEVKSVWKTSKTNSNLQLNYNNSIKDTISNKGKQK